MLIPDAARIDADARLRIAHLVVVSGPSGSGKTTFMNSQLALNALAAEVSAALPVGASSWPRTNGSRIRGRVASTIGENGEIVLPGVVLHYDIMRVVDTRIREYADDPALAALAKADAVTVVVIHAPANALVRRIARTPHKMSNAVRRLLKRFEVRFFRRRSASIYFSPDLTERHQRLATLYLQPGFLSEREAAWEQFLLEAAGGRIISILSVEPVGAAAFRLQDDGQGVMKSGGGKD